MSPRVRRAATSAEWPEALGLALRDWRRAAKLTQASAARSAGVSSTWCRWEAGDPARGAAPPAPGPATLRPMQLSPLVRAGVPVAELVRSAAVLCASDRPGRYVAP